MADSFSPNFNLTLPEIGASFDTWGDKLNNNLSEIDKHLVPIGGIIMYEGLEDDIPSNWALCDGTNGTPDLRGMFVVGAGGAYGIADSGGANSVTLDTDQLPAHAHAASSGEAGAHAHAASSGEAGAHTHSASSGSAGSHSHSSSLWSGVDGAVNSFRAGTSGAGSSTTRSVNSAGSHSHSISVATNGNHTHPVTVESDGTHTHSITTENTGGGQSHENRPPYYALAYIKHIG